MVFKISCFCFDFLSSLLSLVLRSGKGLTFFEKKMFFPCMVSVRVDIIRTMKL